MPEHHAGHRHTVLFVDDDEALRRLGEISLGRLEGWRVLTAADGVEAISTATREIPDVILMDAFMPRMDGTAAIASLRGNPATRGIPVIMVSGRAGPEEQKRFLALGARGVITKPFLARELGERVLAILNGP